MKASNIIIFLVVLIVIAGIFTYAIWDTKNNTENDTNLIENVETNEEDTGDRNLVDDIGQGDLMNVINGGDDNSKEVMSFYEGEWYISEEAYTNSEKIDELMHKRKDNIITEEEFESQLQDIDNDEVAELDVDECYEGVIEFDFTLTGPAPTQRVAKIEDVVVSLTNNVGTFSYIDNWGTSGNGTITLTDGQIELTLETTNASQGALWGVEGSYTFSYRLAD